MDKLDRLERLADDSYELDPPFAKQCLSDAAKQTSGQDGDDAEDLQRNIVDLANTLSPEFGSHISSLLDKDPARASAKKQLQLSDLRKKMLDEGTNPTELVDIHGDQIPSSAWKILGRLNGGRAETVHIEHTREYVRHAARPPMSDAFPILSWAIENACRRLGSSKEQAQTTLRGIYRASIQACDLSAWLATKNSCRYYPKALPKAESRIFGPGERERALANIRTWLEANAVDYLKLCDQFIGPDEVVEILRMVLSASPKISVYIVTSRKHQTAERIPMPWEDAYRLKWRTLMDQDPPDTTVVIAGLPSGDAPIHDRWWVTDGKGFRTGTSLNSVGTSKASEVTPLKEDEVAEFEAEIDSCLRLTKRGPTGERVSFSVFNL